MSDRSLQNMPRSAGEKTLYNRLKMRQMCSLINYEEPDDFSMQHIVCKSCLVNRLPAHD